MNVVKERSRLLGDRLIRLTKFKPGGWKICFGKVTFKIKIWG